MTPLRQWRGDRTLREVAALFEISIPSLSRIERGQQWMGPALLQRVVAVTGLSAGDILQHPADAA